MPNLTQNQETEIIAICTEFATQNQETEIIATIDELNQYRNGNVTDEGILHALESLIEKIYASAHSAE
tara:strand:- start:126 stop:329 length:204 start_codon:yes stop_codon:yes gene_type:complete